MGTNIWSVRSLTVGNNQRLVIVAVPDHPVFPLRKVEWRESPEVLTWPLSDYSWHEGRKANFR